MPIHRMKRGPANKKAFLSKKGQQILKDREQAFLYILTNHQSFADLNKLMVEDLFLFSNRKNPNKRLSRADWNNSLNEIIKQFVKKHDLCIESTTHRFRHNFIQSVWKDSKDIVAVKEIIGHGSVKAT